MMSGPGRILFSAATRWTVLVAAASLLFPKLLFAQAVPYARTFQKSSAEVEAALKDLQAYSGQKLPILDGFVATGDGSPERYERGFYQFSIDLLPGSTSGTIVRLTAKITAWYKDKDPWKSGYQVLPSNGRLELDLLDRLEEKFGGKPSSAIGRARSNSVIMAPKPKLDLGREPGAAMAPRPEAAANSGDTGNDELGTLRVHREAEEKRMQELNAEIQSLQEFKRNQAHPANLVAVKKAGTPIFAKPSEGSHVLFNAAPEDEFEFIEAAGEWIHVQISGASRGYVRRSSVELPERIAARLNSPNGAVAEEKSAAFRMIREEASLFPGEWEQLKGKTVKIYTVQPVSENSKEVGAAAKRAFAAAVFQQYATEASAPGVEGVVVIFNSADGGIIAATVPSVRQLAAGTITSENFWKLCYLDPPDAFQAAHKP